MRWIVDRGRDGPGRAWLAECGLYIVIVVVSMVGSTLVWARADLVRSDAQALRRLVGEISDWSHGHPEGEATGRAHTIRADWEKFAPAWADGFEPVVQEERGRVYLTFRSGDFVQGLDLLVQPAPR